MQFVNYACTIRCHPLYNLPHATTECGSKASVVWRKWTLFTWYLIRVHVQRTHRAHTFILCINYYHNVICMIHLYLWDVQMEFLQANLHFLAVKVPMNYIRTISIRNKWSIYIHIWLAIERAIQFISIIGNIWKIISHKWRMRLCIS